MNPSPSPEAQPSAEPQRRPNWLRRAARLLLITGVALALAPVVGELFSERQQLVFDLGPRSPQVRSIDLAWTPAGQDRPAGGLRLGAEAIKTSRIRHQLDVPNGWYVFDVSVETAQGGRLTKTTHSRRVNLQGGETTIFLGD